MTDEPNECMDECCCGGVAPIPEELIEQFLRDFSKREYKFK